MSNLNKDNSSEDKELLKKIYLEIENGKSLSKEKKDELTQVISKLEKKCEDDNKKKSMIIKLKDKLKNIEVTGPEKNIKKIIKESIEAILMLLG